MGTGGFTSSPVISHTHADPRIRVLTTGEGTHLSHPDVTDSRLDHPLGFCSSARYIQRSAISDT